MIRKALVAAAIVLFALACIDTAHAQYQPGQPGLILVPSTTTPSTTVEAIGFGCAKKVVVTLKIDGDVVGTGISGDDPKGSFDIKFTAPPEVGQYVVVATCKATSGNGETVVSSVLTVIAAPTTTTSIITSTLPPTGASSTMFLVRLGLGLVAVGGLVVLVVRRRREA